MFEFEKLPELIKKKIIDFLDPNSFGTSMLVSKIWHQRAHSFKPQQEYLVLTQDEFNFELAKSIFNQDYNKFSSFVKLIHLKIYDISPEFFWYRKYKDKVFWKMPTNLTSAYPFNGESLLYSVVSNQEEQMFTFLLNMMNRKRLISEYVRTAHITHQEKITFSCWTKKWINFGYCDCDDDERVPHASPLTVALEYKNKFMARKLIQHGAIVLIHTEYFNWRYGEPEVGDRAYGFLENLAKERDLLKKCYQDKIDALESKLRKAQEIIGDDNIEEHDDAPENTSKRQKVSHS